MMSTTYYLLLGSLTLCGGLLMTLDGRRRARRAELPTWFQNITFLGGLIGCIASYSILILHSMAALGVAIAISICAALVSIWRSTRRTRFAA